MAAVNVSLYVNNNCNWASSRPSSVNGTFSMAMLGGFWVIFKVPMGWPPANPMAQLSILRSFNLTQAQSMYAIHGWLNGNVISYNILLLFLFLWAQWAPKSCLDCADCVFHWIQCPARPAMTCHDLPHLGLLQIWKCLYWFYQRDQAGGGNDMKLMINHWIWGHPFEIKSEP